MNLLYILILIIIIILSQNIIGGTSEKNIPYLKIINNKLLTNVSADKIPDYLNKKKFKYNRIWIHFKSSNIEPIIEVFHKLFPNLIINIIGESKFRLYTVNYINHKTIPKNYIEVGDVIYTDY